MRKLSFGLLCLLAAPAGFARDLGVINATTTANVVRVEVTGSTAELNGLAQFAFSTDGRYQLVEGYERPWYEIAFAPAGADAVTVTITRGVERAPSYSETVTGRSLDEALLRAADVAVERTNGLGLRGYFNSEIAFVAGAGMHKDVYAGGLFFTHFRRLTDDRADALFPSWSPDGTRLVYTSYRDMFPDIFLIDLRDYRLNVFASYRGTNEGARFSPDGRRVVMMLTGASGDSQLWVSDAYGHGLRQLTHFSSEKSSPCWSPDGGQIVFASSLGSEPQLYVTSSYGGTARRITHGVSGYCAEPDWNRTDPDKIAFTVAEGYGRSLRYQIAVLSLSSGEAHVVSHASFDGIEPAWLPDGRHLIYTARNAYMSRLCVLDTVSGKSTPISPSTFGPAEQANVLEP